MAKSRFAPRVSGVINIGGGITKSFLRQTEMSAHIFKTSPRHKYAIRSPPTRRIPWAQQGPLPSMNAGVTAARPRRADGLRQLRRHDRAADYHHRAFTDRREVHERPPPPNFTFGGKDPDIECLKLAGHR